MATVNPVGKYFTIIFPNICLCLCLVNMKERDKNGERRHQRLTDVMSALHQSKKSRQEAERLRRRESILQRIDEEFKICVNSTNYYFLFRGVVAQKEPLPKPRFSQAISLTLLTLSQNGYGQSCGQILHDHLPKYMPLPLPGKYERERQKRRTQTSKINRCHVSFASEQEESTGSRKTPPPGIEPGSSA